GDGRRGLVAGLFGRRVGDVQLGGVTVVLVGAFHRGVVGSLCLLAPLLGLRVRHGEPLDLFGGGGGTTARRLHAPAQFGESFPPVGDRLGGGHELLLGLCQCAFVLLANRDRLGEPLPVDLQRLAQHRFFLPHLPGLGGELVRVSTRLLRLLRGGQVPQAFGGQLCRGT